MHMDGTKENAKGGTVSVFKTLYTFVEKKSKHKPPERVNVLNYVPKDCLCYEEAKP
jgi:hypothetical protein